MSGVELIRKERQRQRSKSRGWGEAYSLTHDDSHDKGELACAAACYAIPPARRARYGEAMGGMWPWNWRFKRTDDRIRELTIAGALIAAEIDRLLRAVEREDGEA